MVQRRSRQGAAEPARIRIISAWSLVGVTLMVAAGLVLLFPKQALMERLRRETGNDTLTANYLANLLRTEPSNQELRVLLAEKHMAMGKAADAREALAPLLASPDDGIRRRALMLDLRIAVRDVQARKQGDPGRAVLAARAAKLVAAMAGEAWAPQELVYLTRQARALGDAALAGRLIARLLERRDSLPPAFLTESAAIELGEGDYREASLLYFAARDRTADPAERRELWFKGVAALQSGNLPAEALAAAERHLGELAGDDRVLAFLVRLALAANDPARAQQYMKKLLRIGAAGGPGPLRQALAAALDWMVSPAHAQASPPVPGAAAPPYPGDRPAPATRGMRPYDEELYKLAFDVFMANGNQEDAWRVAAAAVEQRPADAFWRERLARVSEWSARPGVALRQWVWLVQHGASAESVQAVLRLAPGLNDDEALLLAWQAEAGRRKLAPAEWRLVADAFERLGRADEGIAWLEKQHAANGEPALLEVLADFEERAGRVEQAIATYQRLVAASGATPQRAVKLATLHFLRADYAGAYKVLEPLRASAPRDAEDYWELLAEVAWQLQDDAVARQAYGLLAEREQPEASALERLMSLMRDAQPQEAARLGEAAWARFGSVAGLLLALESAAGSGDGSGVGQADRARQRRLFGSVGPEQEARLATNAYFYQLRAAWLQSSGRTREALADWRTALRIAPRGTEVRAGLVYFLVEAAGRGELRRELRAELLRAEAVPDAALADAYAAGWTTLEEPARALAWMSRRRDARKDDYLWLLNYADLLEQAGRGDYAWRVRRHAWDVGRRQMARADTASRPAREKLERLVAYARMVMQQQPGDASLAVVRRVLRQDREGLAARAAELAGSAGAQTGKGEAQPNAPDAGLNALDALSAELVLGWLISTEQVEAQKEWLWKQYGRRLAAPVWAEASVALATKDIDALERLLEQKAEALPRYNRIDAARETQRLRLAQQIGFQELERRPDDDEIHLRLATDMLASASSIIARDAFFTRGLLSGHENSVRAQVWVTPALRLSAELSLWRQTTMDAPQLAYTPGVDRATTASVMLRDGRGDTELSLGQRSGLSDFTTAKLSRTHRLMEGLNAEAGLSLRERALETIPMMVAGHKDEAHASANWSPGRREYITARFWSARYHTQQETFLGTGRGVALEAGHRLRLEYPDLAIRASRLISHFSPAELADGKSALLVPPGGLPAGGIPAGSFFLPASFKLWGINASFGTALREQYGRGIRPFMDVGRTHNTASGNGYNWLVGAGGSMAGHDYLSAYMLRSKGGGGANVAIREMGLRYQYYFDRF